LDFKTQHKAHTTTNNVNMLRSENALNVTRSHDAGKFGPGQVAEQLLRTEF